MPADARPGRPPPDIEALPADPDAGRRLARTPLAWFGNSVAAGRGDARLAQVMGRRSDGMLGRKR